MTRPLAADVIDLNPAHNPCVRAEDGAPSPTVVSFFKGLLVVLGDERARTTISAQLAQIYGKAATQEQIIADIQDAHADLQEALEQEGPAQLLALNAFGQKHLLRTQGKERWQDIPSPTRAFLATQYIRLQPSFELIAVLQDLRPSGTEYTRVLVQGATVSTMAERLTFLARMIREQGLKESSIVMVTGERPLQEGELAQIPDLVNQAATRGRTFTAADIKTETDAARLLLATADFAETTYNNARVIGAEPINGRRPNTGEAIIAWLNTDQLHTTQQAVRLLSVSGQPFAQYQHQTLRAILAHVPKTQWYVETCAGAFNLSNARAGLNIQGIPTEFLSPEMAFVILALDSIARTLYTVTPHTRASSRG